MAAAKKFLASTVIGSNGRSRQQYFELDTLDAADEDSFLGDSPSQERNSTTRQNTPLPDIDDWDPNYASEPSRNRGAAKPIWRKWKFIIGAVFFIVLIIFMIAYSTSRKDSVYSDGEPPNDDDTSTPGIHEPFEPTPTPTLAPTEELVTPTPTPEIQEPPTPTEELATPTPTPDTQNPSEPQPTPTPTDSPPVIAEPTSTSLATPEPVIAEPTPTPTPSPTEEPSPTTPASPSDAPSWNSTFVNLVSSPNDRRRYTLGKLPNGLQVLLVSDPDTTLSSVAVNVDAGSLLEPLDVPGMAHFLEHLLFMGSEAYPGENEYGEYLSLHGGTFNAYTSTDNTNYYFQVSSDYLEQPLDILAQFFVTPLMNVSSIEREANAVNNEHTKNIQRDDWRLYRMIQLSANDASPFHHFFTGSLETLLPNSTDDELQERLFEFYRAHYAANTMHVVVYGKDSTEQLYNWTLTSFGPVLNDTTPPTEQTEIDLDAALAAVFGADQLGHFYYIIPFTDIRRLTLMWATPSLQRQYNKNPFPLLAELLGYEGHGSLFELLRQNEWALSISAEVDNYSFATLPLLIIELTEQGVANVDNVIKLVFGYIQMLSDQDDDTLYGFFNETQSIAETQWLFPTNTNPSTTTSSLAARLQYVTDPEDILKNPTRSIFDIELVRNALATLVSPVQMIAFLESRVLPATEYQTEQYYDIWYNSSSFSSQQLEAWTNVTYNSTLLFFPLNNPYLITNFEVNPVNQSITLPAPQDVDELVSFWYLQDPLFLEIRDVLQVQLITTIDFNGVNGQVLTSLYAKLFTDRIAAELYPAVMAGFTVTIAEGKPGGLLLRFEGWSQKMPDLISLVVDELHNANFSIARFNLTKTKMIEDIQNAYYTDAYQQASYWNRLILLEQRFSREEILVALQGLDFDTFVDCIGCIFSKVKVEALWVGNSNLDDAIAAIAPLVNLTQKTTECVSDSCPLSDEPEKPILHVTKLPEGDHVLRVTYNQSINTALMTYWQFGPANIEEQAEIRLLGNMLSELAFNQLRTIEQLGYIVSAFTDVLANVFAVSIIIQSITSPDVLAERAHAFWETVEPWLESLTEEDIKNQQNVVASLILAPPVFSMGAHSDALFVEVLSGEYMFDRSQQLVKQIQKQTPADLRSNLIKIVENLVKSCLDVEVFITDYPDDVGNATLIDNWQQFKDNATFYDVGSPTMP